jgi:hypothetical protein
MFTDTRNPAHRKLIVHAENTRPRRARQSSESCDQKSMKMVFIHPSHLIWPLQISGRLNLWRISWKDRHSWLERVFFLQSTKFCKRSTDWHWNEILTSGGQGVNDGVRSVETTPNKLHFTIFSIFWSITIEVLELMWNIQDMANGLNITTCEGKAIFYRMSSIQKMEFSAGWGACSAITQRNKAMRRSRGENI